MSETKVSTFRLDDITNARLNQFRPIFGINRTQAVEQSVEATTILINEAAIQTAPRWDSLFDEYSEDAVVAIRPLTSDGDTPQLELTVNGQPVADAYAVGRVTHDGKLCLVYLMERSPAPSHYGQFVTIGNTMVYIAQARMPIGEMDWPPDPDRPVGIAFRLGDVGKVPEADELLMKPASDTA